MQDQIKSPGGTAAYLTRRSEGPVWSKSAGQSERMLQGYLSDLLSASGIV